MFRKILLLIVLLYVPVGMNAQSGSDSKDANTRYLEDQFYLGITYNFLLNQPEGVNQQNLSYGLQGGFIRDIPFNSDRTVGIGIGLGLGLNTYYSNIRVTKQLGEIQYDIIDEAEFYKRSKLETHSIEVPFEFRWRNSTSSEYKFWRIYAGLKFAYVYDARSKFVSEEQKVSFSNPDAKNLQYGLTLNFGYNSFNAHIYYSLTNLFEDKIALGQESVEMKPLRIGLIFYIL